MAYKNSTGLGLTMCLWLAADQYDHEYEGAPEGVPVISVTSLLQPTKALILANRIPETQKDVELVDVAKARMGQSIHSGIEAAFEHPHRAKILTELGFAPRIVDHLVLNPTEGHLKADPQAIPIYLEKRSYRLITCSDGTVVAITGKFDQVLAGQPEDNKTTSVYKFQKSSDGEDDDYAVQMSLYKWLNPKIITADIGKINFILTDWKKSEMARMKDYPPHPVMERQIQLKDEVAAEEFIRNKLDEIRANAQLPEADMVRCTDEELWRSPDVYKYYTTKEAADAGKRATKNFDSYAAAMAHKATKGKGEIVIAPGQVRRCGYCDAMPLCVQRLEYQ